MKRTISFGKKDGREPRGDATSGFAGSAEVGCFSDELNKGFSLYSVTVTLPSPSYVTSK